MTFVPGRGARCLAFEMPPSRQSPQAQKRYSRRGGGDLRCGLPLEGSGAAIGGAKAWHPDRQGTILELPRVIPVRTMRSPNSPFTAEIFDEWENLVSTEGLKLPLAARKDRWQRLHDGAWFHGSWSVSHHDARLIAGLGITLAMQMEDFDLARNLVSQMFAHPDTVMSKDNEIDIAHFWIQGALADILCGDVEEGLASLRRPFVDKPFSRDFYPAVLRGDYHNLLFSLGFQNRVDPRIAEFASELIAHFPRCITRSRRALRAKSYGELNVILDSTYNKTRPR